MVGEYLLVAPLFTGETERRVILPKGKWYDFYTGKLAGEGEIITVSPGLDRIPVYVKMVVSFLYGQLLRNWRTGNIHWKYGTMERKHPTTICTMMMGKHTIMKRRMYLDIIKSRF